MSFTQIEKWKMSANPESRIKATVWCPDCGLRIGIVGHGIDVNGVLSPSLVCPHDGCGFHRHVQLKDYKK